LVEEAELWFRLLAEVRVEYFFLLAATCTNIARSRGCVVIGDALVIVLLLDDFLVELDYRFQRGQVGGTFWPRGWCNLALLLE
jgi:hypothetical protein